MAGDENLESLTVPQLKEKLKDAGLSQAGKKSELIERLKGHSSGAAAPAEEKKEAAEEAAPAKEEKKVVAGDDKMQVDAEEAKPAEPEEPKELEGDSPKDSRKKIAAGSAAMASSAVDCTLNVMTTAEGKVLTSLTDGGFQHFVSAARSSVGVKAGRYFYEVRVVETRSYSDGGKSKSRQFCGLGFSTAGSSLFLSDGVENVGFDSDGHFVSAGKWSEGTLCKKFVPYTAVYGVLLNLDQKSHNANTISLFCDGVRVSKPQPLPDNLKGKPLFPLVNYKGMTLHVNLGPCCMAPLPFQCPMLQDAAADDAVVTAKAAAGKSEVVFPVGLPDEGTFEWLDDFLKANPQYTEISSRSILNWGLKSGLYQQRGSTSWQGCNDKPNMDFGIQEIDDDTLLKTISSLAPMFKRDYIVMEVKSNLLAEGRTSALANFKGPDFKKVALVVMGEPPKAFKEKGHQQVLEEKRKQVASEVRRKKTMEAAEKRREKKKAEEEAKKEVEKKAGEEGEKKEENENAEVAKVDEEKEAAEEAESIEDAIKKATEAVTLSDQEKAVWFPKLPREDLAQKDLSKSFGDFAIPTKEEGFDEVKFAWSKDAKASEYLKTWIADKKLTQRVEDLQPGARFKEQFQEWTRQMQEWRKRYNERRNAPQQKPPAKKQKVAEEGKEGEGEEGASNENDNGEGTEEAAKPAVKVEDVDPCTVEDIEDIGGGTPLYASFTWEDWMMLALRFEMHLLVHCFKTDANDEERPSFHETHLPFYYYKYFKKQLNVKHYGTDTNVDMLKLIEDTIEVSAQKAILQAQLSEDTPFETFIRLTEDHRRERQQCFDAGDEAAALKLQRPPPRGQQGQQQQQQWGRQSWDGGKGGGRDDYRNRNDNKSQQSYQQYGGRDDSSKGGGYKGGSRAPPPPAIGQGVRRGGPSGGRDDGRSDNRGSRDQGYGDSNRSGGGYGGGGGGGGYPRDSRGAAPAQRSRSPPPPPSARGGAPAPAPSSVYRGGGGGGQRSYAPPTSSSSGGRHDNQGGSYNKPQSSHGSSGPRPSQSQGGSSYSRDSRGGGGGQSYNRR